VNKAVNYKFKIDEYLEFRLKISHYNSLLY